MLRGFDQFMNLVLDDTPKWCVLAIQSRSSHCSLFILCSARVVVALTPSLTVRPCASFVRRPPLGTRIILA